MRHRHRKIRALPTLWLFTDERVADSDLLHAAAALPRGAGIVFRHYRTDQHARRALFHAMRAIARRNHLVLLLAGNERQARQWGADGVHQRPGGRGAPSPKPHWLRSMPVHGARELMRAKYANLLFLSPVFPTRSHPGQPALGPLRFGQIARRTAVPVVALGGMTHRRYTRLVALGARGWAAIDGLTGRPAIRT